MKVKYIILIFLFASFSCCKGQVPKTRKLSKGEVIYSSPYIGEPFPVDTARSASMQALLKMMQDSGITTMPFTSGKRQDWKMSSTLDTFEIDSIGTVVAWWKDSVKLKFDTVKVIMLVCDTTKIEKVKNGEVYFTLPPQYGYDDIKWNVAYWQYGYSVREWNSIYVTYLDEEKNKLPKNIIVWMAKEILPKMPTLKITDPMPH